MEFTRLSIPVIDLGVRHIASFASGYGSFLVYGFKFKPPYTSLYSGSNYYVAITELEALSELIYYRLLGVGDDDTYSSLGTVYFVTNEDEMSVLDMIRGTHTPENTGAFFKDAKNTKGNYPLYVVFAFNNSMGLNHIHKIEKRLQMAIDYINTEATELYKLLSILK